MWTDGRIDDGLSLDVNNGEAKWLYFYGFEGAIFVLEVLFTVFAWFVVWDGIGSIRNTST